MARTIWWRASSRTMLSRNIDTPDHKFPVSARHAHGNARAVREGSGQCRGGSLSAAARFCAGDATRPGEPALSRPTFHASPRADGATAMTKWRKWVTVLPRYLPSEFPFPDRRLSERRLGEAVRISGRGAFRGHGRRDATPRLCAAREISEGSRSGANDAAGRWRGNGRISAFVKSVQPRLKVVALDLSEPYLERARRALSAHGAA